MTEKTTKYSTDLTPMHVSPYITHAGAVTPSDTVDTVQPFKVVTVTVAGNVTWLNNNGDSQVLFCGVPGQPYYIMGKRVMATGTTATGIYWGGGI